MLGEAVLYAASRATSSAVDHVARRAKWMAVAGVLLLCGLVVALVVAYWLTAPLLGPINAAAAIAAACFALGLVCLFMPLMIEKVEAMRRKKVAPAAATAAVVDQEAHEAVDYFGALQVVGAAFLFGMGAARRLKR